MRLGSESAIGVGTLIAVSLVLSASTVVLLTRMGPAVERILHENVYSEVAVEDMLAALAAPPDDAEARARFDAALARARGNVTEPDEPRLLEIADRAGHAALDGHAPSRTRAIVALRRLGHVNRASVVRADRRAQQLGLAGAWAAAVLGALGLWLGIVVHRRLRLRVELPVIEIRRTLRDVRRGSRQARCHIVDAPSELAQIGTDLNWLLDRESPRASVSELDPQGLRRALAQALDAYPEPVFLVDEDGQTVAANVLALEVERPPFAGTPSPDAPFSVEPIEGTALSLVRLRRRATVES